ncbi:MAG: aminoacyl-tRNA hydrolase [Rhodobacterales bacterium]|nr:aminoacyl-tRNA hydrolase [Rhodobacterales bacterium]
MLLLVGLGNPGSGYAQNRHNIGFMAVDVIVHRHGFSPWRRKFQGEVAEGTIGGRKVLALKPLTYMNESGRAVQAAATFYRISPAQILVLHDDMDLAPGKVRLKIGGGHGGHNGLRSIQAHLGPDFRRLRLGVGHPGDRDRVIGHVLNDFAKADRDWLDKLLDVIADEAPRLAKNDDAGFMNRVALVMNPPKPKKPRPPKDADGAGDDKERTDDGV